ncbi:MAG: integration host factor subunit beta, partial [Polynucleobacter sp. 24-46-87]
MSDQEQQAITRSELVESLAEQFPQLLPRDV